MAHLIDDVLPFETTILEDKRAEGGRLRVGGKVQCYDIRNENKRIYPKSVWEKVLGSEWFNKDLSERAVLGELDHPTKDKPARIEDAALVMTKVEMRPNGIVYGEYETLPTPKGRVLESLLDAGIRLGISSRGDGSVVSRNGYSEVQDDFRPHGWDVVLRPSTPGAFPSVLREAVEDSTDLGPVVSAITEAVRNSTNEDDVTYFKSLLTEMTSSGPRPTPPTEVSARREVVTKPEARMSLNMEDLSVDTKALMNNIIREEIAKLDEKYTTKLKAAEDLANTRLDQLTEATKNLESAKQLVTESMAQLKSKNMIIDKLTEEAQEMTESLEWVGPRYDVARKLIANLWERAKRGRMVEQRFAASAALVEAFRTRIDRTKVEAVISQLTAGLHEEKAGKIRKLLETCSTADQVKEQFQLLSEVAPGRYPGLPTKENRTQALKEEEARSEKKPTLRERLNESASSDGVRLTRMIAKKMRSRG